MPKKRLGTEQIVTKLRQVEVLQSQGKSVAAACKDVGLTEQSYYRYRKEYGGLNVEQARKLKQLYVEAGIPRASSHSGRRTFITGLAERGIDLKAISVLAGHSNIRTTAMYVDNNPLRLARILEEVSW